MGSYTDPKKAGYLLEAAACDVVVSELDCLIGKYQRKVEKEDAVRRKALDTALKYASLEELQNAYGYAEITKQQYYLYQDLLEQGAAALENHTPTKSECVTRMLRCIRSDVESERRELNFFALSPEEQAEELKRAETAKQEWKNQLQKIKERQYKAGESGAET